MALDSGRCGRWPDMSARGVSSLSEALMACKVKGPTEPGAGRWLRSSTGQGTEVASCEPDTKAVSEEGEGKLVTVTSKKSKSMLRQRSDGIWTDGMVEDEKREAAEESETMLEGWGGEKDETGGDRMRGEGGR